MPSIFSMSASIGLNSAGYEAGMRAAAKVTDAFTETTVQAVRSSVEVAAQYERTANAMKTLTGSARLANQALNEAQQLSKKTTGLGLRDAEDGIKRLTALNFTLKQSKDTMAGLAKQKILSGADDEAINRMIFNFAQIRSGGQKFSQEMREILTAMPTLQKVFAETFGTLNPQKLQQIFDSSPSAFFGKLAAGMNKAGDVQGDLIDAQQKFYDQLELSGRAFAKPFLPQLTTSLKELTTDFDDNEATFKKWGQNAATALDFVSNIGETRLVTLSLRLLDLKNRLDAAMFTAGGSFGATPVELGQRIRGVTDKVGLTDPNKNCLTGRSKNEIAAGLGDVNELLVEAAKQEFETLQKAERERAKSLQSLDSYYQTRRSIVEDGFNIESARIDSGLKLTFETQSDGILKLGKLKAEMLKSQLNVETAYFNERARLNADNTDELTKIDFDRAQTLGKINAEIIVNERKTQRELAELAQKVVEARREALQELNRLNRQAARQSLNSATSGFDRAAALVGYDAADFNNFKSQLQASYAEISQLSSSYFSRQLESESLTAEQRANILRQSQIEQVGITNELNNRLLDLDDKLYRERLQKLETFTSNSISLYGARKSIYGDVGNLLSPQNFGSKTSGIISDVLLRGNEFKDLARQISEAEAAQISLRAQMDAFKDSNKSKDVGRNGGLDFSSNTASTEFWNGGSLTETYGKMADASTLLRNKTDELRTAQEKLKDGVPDLFKTFEGLAQQIGGGNVRAFDGKQKIHAHG